MESQLQRRQNEDASSMPVHKTSVEINIGRTSLLQACQSDHNFAGSRIRGIQSPKVGITWKDLIVTTKPFLDSLFGVGSLPRERTILSGISGCALPGTLLGIMGSSGVEKSAFLNCLANRNTSELRLSGEIRINGRPANRETKSIMAFVQQNDLYFETLTVHEHLMFQAVMRMDRNTTEAERLERVKNLLLEVGLKTCQNSLIGQPKVGKGLSGWERKRLAFATEMITDPPVIFCDEPTTGFESFMAKDLVSILRRLAAKGKNVICTINQTSSEVFTMFDRLLLLAGGRTAYLGPTYEALEFFNSIGYVCPSTINPADFYVRLLGAHSGFESRDKNSICDKFESSVWMDTLQDDMTRTCSFLQDQDLYLHANGRKIRWLTQFGQLLRRAFLDSTRNTEVIIIRTLQKIVKSKALKLKEGSVHFLALVLAFCYFQCSLNQEVITATSGAIFIFIAVNVFPNHYGVLHTFPNELPTVFREHENGDYRIDAYYLSKILALLPESFIETFLLASICYWMIGLHQDLIRFAMTIAILILTENAASACGYFFSVAFEDYSFSTRVLVFFDVMLISTSRIFINTNKNPNVINWTQQISWFRYCYEAIMITQWDQVHNTTCANRPDVPCPTDGSSVLEHFGLHQGHLWWNLTFLAIMYGVYHVLGMIVIIIRSRK